MSIDCYYRGLVLAIGKQFGGAIMRYELLIAPFQTANRHVKLQRAIDIRETRVPEVNASARILLVGRFFIFGDFQTWSRWQLSGDRGTDDSECDRAKESIIELRFTDERSSCTRVTIR